jgi:hypothetical protein
MISALCLSVCVSISFKLLDFYEIQHGGHVIEDNIDAMLYNLVASNFTKW